MPTKHLVPSKKSAPAKREERDPFSLFRQEMNRLFDSFFMGADIEPFESRLGTFNPNINIVEGAKEFKVSAELPGMDDKDIDISLSKDALTISGEKKEEKEDKGKNYYRIESSYGSFSRTIPIPSEIETDKVKAEFKKGVLNITLPKTAKSIKETKKISVKAE